MEISINGEITSETTMLCNDLEGDIRVRLNSYGGDISAALTCYNRLKAHVGAVEVIIEGIAASAATVIACAGYVKMAVNGLYMIHSPLLELYGDFNSEELQKRITGLRAVEEVLIETYAVRTSLSKERLRDMLAEETWLTAEDARRLGFVDEVIEEAVPAEEVEGSYKVNAVEIPRGRFKNKAALRKMVKDAAFLLEEKQMDNETLLSRLKAFFGREKSEREIELEAEVERLQAELKATQAAVKTTEEIYALIEDNVRSGSAGVRGSTSEPEDGSAKAINKVVYYGNRGRK